MSALNRKIKRIIAEGGQRSRVAARIESLVREREAKAVEAFAATLGVDVGDEDDDWWRGYRQGQRRALHGAVEFAAKYRKVVKLVA